YGWTDGSGTTQGFITTGTQAQLSTTQQGTVTVYVWAQDNAGNIGGSGSDVITMDIIGPNLSIIYPTEDIVLCSTLNITFTGSDSVTTIIGTPSISIDGGVYSEAGSWSAPNGTLSINTASGYADGLHTIMIRAIDSSGMTGYSAVRRCYFDNTAPNISITATPDPAGSDSVVTLTLVSSERLNAATVSVTQAGTSAVIVALSLKPGQDTVWTGTYSVVSGFNGIAQITATATDRAISAGNAGTCSGNFVVDTIMPIGTITINNGDVYAISLNVQLGLQYSTDTIALRLRNSDESWDSYLWETPVTIKPWQLSSGSNGTRTVYMQLKDSSGNIATATLGEIYYDGTIPQATITIGSGNPAYTTQDTATIYLEYSAPTEVGTVALSNDGTNWTVIATNSTPASYTNWSLGGSDGTKWVYVKVTDKAGNSGQFSDSIILDTQGPGCYVVVNEDDLYTNDGTVTLTISAYDPFSGVNYMSLSNDGTTWSATETYATSKVWSLVNGTGGTTTNGERRVYIRFVDGAGITAGTSTDKIVYDNTAPAGTMSINHAANLTISRDVRLVIEYSDNSSQFGTSTSYGVQKVRYGTDGTTWGQWESVVGIRQWRLDDVQGTQTVWCELMDACGNTKVASSSINYDSNAPAGTITINSGAAYTTSATVTLTLEKGVASDTCWVSNDGVNWTLLSAFGTTTSTAWSLLPADGLKFTYFKVQDTAGNVSEYVDWIVLDSTVPFGSVVINDGAVYSTSTTLKLTLSYNDVASGVAYARYRDDASGWGTWTTPATTTTYSLSSSVEGLRTVYYQIKDVLEHESDVYSDSIILDTTSPRGTITINQGTSATSSKEVLLTISYEDLISGSATEGSGVDVVRFRNAGTGATWGGWESPVTTKPWWLESLGGTVGENRTVEFQIRDKAGLMSTVTSGTIMLNDIAPSGTLTINSGAVYAGTHTVTLRIDYVNLSGGAVRFSNERSIWSDWSTNFDDKPWILSAGDGSKLVYCQMKNNAGLTHECSDTIIVDATGPFGSMIINNGAEYASSTAIVMSVEYNDLVSGVNQVRYTGAVDVSWGTPTSGTNATMSSTDEGVKTVYFVMQDNAGNIGTATDTIIYDHYSPTGTITINNGAALTNDREVYLSLSYEDSISGVDMISLREGTTTWGAWESAVTARKLIMSSGDGDKSVYYRIKDKSGRVSVEYSDTITLDTSAPSGTLSINNGSLTTASSNVVLYLAYSGAPTQVRFSNDGQVWGEWNVMAGTYSWTIPLDDGQKRVYAQLQDAAGNTSECSDTILFDTTAAFGSVIINQGAGYTNTRTVTLSITYHDTGCGVADVGYYNNGAWSSWLAVSGDEATLTTTLTTTEGMQTVYYRIRDNIGNVSGTYSDSIILDTTAPSGTLTINTGAAYTSSRDVILSLEYSSDVQYVRYQEGGTPTTQGWESISAARPMILSSGDNTKTVYAEIKDYAGNTAVIHGTITLTTAEGGILINNGSPTTTSGSVTLNLSYNPNTTSEVRYSNGGGTWTTWTTATSTLASWQLTAGDGIKTVYYQAKNNNGSIAEYSDSIILDTTKPFGSIVINDGAQYTATTSVTLKFTAADSMSGVEAVRYNETLGSWMSVVDEATYTLTASNGTKTVYYQLRDNAGIVSATYSDTIILDTINPTGTITINQNATYTSKLDVKLVLSWVDESSGVRYVRFRQGTETPATNWSDWESQVGERVFTLVAVGDGTRTVYWQLQDYAGNTSGTYSDTIKLDTTGPSGSVSILGGLVYATSATMVINYICPIDTEGVRFSVDDRVTWSTWTTPVGTTGTVALTFAAGDGTKRVYYQVRDYKGDTIELTDTIVLDTRGPGCHILVNEDDLYTNNGTVTLTVSAYDPLSGVGSMSLSNDGASWSAWQAYMYGTLSWSMINGAGGTTTNGYRYVHVRFMDNAGNIDGTTTDKIMYDNTVPMGTLTINEAATYTTSRQVRLNTSFSDNSSGIELVRYGTDGTNWADWEQIAGMRMWAFDADGTQAVSMQLMDRCGNTSTVVSDSIMVDTSVPQITVNSPAASAVVKGTVAITFSVDQQIVGTPSIQIDGGSFVQVSQWAASVLQGTYTWNTAGISDDSHVFVIRAQDAAGNVGCSDMRLVVVGNASTPVTIVTPLPEARVTGSVTVKATAPDTTVRCEFEVALAGTTTTWNLQGANGTRSVDSLGSDGWMGTWRTTSFTPDGTYTLKVYAYDINGEIGSDSISVRIDNTVPTGSVSVGALLKGMATVTFTSSEADVVRVIFEYGSSAGTYTIGVDTITPFNTSWNTTNMVDGTYTVIATAIDGVGLLYATSSTSCIDNTAPIGTITAPVAGAVIRGTVSITSQWADSHTPGSIEMRVDGGTWTALSDWNTVNWADGAHSLRLRCADSLGNMGETEARLVIVDNTAPVGSVSAAAYTNTNTVILSLSYHDATSQVVSANYSDNGSVWTGWGTPTATYSLTLGSTGHRIIYYAIQDTAGNVSTLTTTILYDGTLPQGTITINSGAAYTSSRFVTLRLEYSDDTSGVASVRYSNDGTFTSAWEMANVVKQWELSSGDGVKTVSYQVKDNAGNVYTANDTIVLDTTPCATLTVSSPISGTTYRGSITLTAIAQDTNAVDRVEFYVDGVLSTQGSGSVFNATWATTAANDGAHSVYFKAIDAAGNGTSSQMISIIVDNTIPESVGIIRPQHGAHVSGTFSIEAVAADAINVARVEFYDGATLIGSRTSSPWAIAVNSTTLSEGSHTLSARCIDGAGNSLDSEGLSIEVDNTQPAGSITAASLIRGVATVSYNTSHADIERVVFEYGSSAGTYTIGVDTTSPFNVSWNTSNMIDGTYTVQATAIDEVGLSYATGSTSVVDNTAPVLLFSSPAGSSVVQGMVNITFSGQDGITGRIGTPTIIIAGNEYTATNWGTNTGLVYGTYTWDTGVLNDGVYLVQIKAVDTAGNVGYSQIRSYETNNANEALTLIVPAASSRICGTIIVEAVAGGDVASVVFAYEYPADTWTTIGTDTSSESGWTATWTTSASGTYNVRAVSYNVSGSMLASDVNYNVVVDNEAPAVGVSVASIVGGPKVATITATGVSSDVVQVVFEYSSGAGTYTIGVDTTSPFTMNWNTSNMADGTYTVLATAIDLVGLSSQASTTCRMDNTAPVFGVDYPAEWALIKGAAVSIRFSGMDTTTQIVGTPCVSIDGGTWTAASQWSSNMGTYSVSLIDGEHTVRIKGTDTAGNVGYSREMHLKADATAPALSITATPSPASGSSIVRITVAATEDLLAAPTVSVLQAGTTSATNVSMILETGFSRQWTGTYTVIQGYDGTAVILATGTDRADNGGNVGTASGSFVADTASPTGTLSINSGNTYTTSLDAVLSLAYSSDVSLIRYRNSGGEWTPWEGAGSVRQWLLASGVSGNRSVDAQVKDNAGNVATISDTILYDATLPVGTVSIAGGAVYATGSSVNLGFTYEIAGEAASIAISNNGVTWTSISGTPSTYNNWILEGSDGTKWVYFKIIDASGLEAVCADSIILDRQGPGCRVLVNEDDLYTNNGTVTLSLSAGDEMSGVGSMSLSNDGASWSAWQAYMYGTLSWSMINGAGGTTTNGYRYVHVRFMDNAGNIDGTTTDKIMYDNTVPMGTLTINEAATYTTSRQVRLNTSFSDNSSGIELVRYGTDGTNWADWEQIAGMRMWAFDADGTQAVSMQLMDRCGNTSTVVSDSIMVDTSVPQITVNSPAASAVVKGTVAITFSVDQQIVGTPSIQIDGGSFVQVSQWAASVLQGTYTWNTAGISDDSHVFVIRAQDAAGNVGCSDMRLVVVGNASTPVTIVTPLPEARVTGSVTVKATAPDTTVRCEFEVALAGTTTTWNLQGANGTRSVDSLGSDGWMGTWRTTSFTPDGTYTLKVYAYDINGEIGSDSISVRIDNTVPTGSVSVGALLKGMATVTFTSSEADVVRVIFEYGSSAGTYTIGVDTITPFNTSWNTTNMVDGTYTVIATAIDGVGLLYATSSTSCIDNTAPIGTITAPVAGAVIRGTVSITSQWADSHTPGSIEMRVDGGTWTALSDWNTVNWADGAHSLRLRCADSLGNMGETEARLVIVDNTAPVGSVSAAAYTNTNTVILSLSYHDATSQVVSANYSDNGSVWTGWGTPTATYSLTLGSTGHRIIYYAIQDTAGNVSTLTTTILYDGTLPQGTITINSGAAYTSSRFVTLRLEYSDDTSGVASVRYSNDGTFTSAWEMANVVKQWELSSGDGVKTVSYQVKDNAGNVYTANDTIVLDTTPCATLTVSSPISGTTYRGSITLTAIAQDTNAVDRVEFYVDGVLSTQGSGSVFNATWATTAANDGAHSVYFKAIDAAGNGTSSQMISIIVDNTIPESVGIIRPQHGAHVSGTFSIEAVAADAINVARVEFYDGATLIGSRTSSPWAIAVNSTTLSEGSHTLSARCIDGAGNSLDSEGLSIEVDNTQPAGSITAASLIRGVATVSYNTSHADIERVVFEYGSSAGTYTIGVDTTSPFNVSWNTSNMIDGTYTVQATAIDEVGLSYATGSTSVV
ncbi:MAG: Ig-like domain-containing protein, partial [bacterium]|nr:Ig-like domain-containing protein [bacterium]